MSLADELVALSGTALLGADASGRIVFANAAAETLLGAPMAELRGRPLSGLGVALPPDETAWRAVASVETGSGTPVPCLVAGRRLAEGAGAAIALALTDLRDARAREALGADLAALRPLERVARLSGGIAHDLKNVFQVLLGHGELIRRRLPDDPRLHASLDHMVKAAERGTESTEAIATLGRMAGRPRAAVSLGDVIREALAGFRPGLPAGVALHAVVSDPAPVAHGDALALRRVVEELVANAIAAVPRRGVVTVSAESRPGGGSELTVRDTGDGMTADQLEQARGPHALTGIREDGRGLGLAVVKRIVREHGGTLEIGSEPGSGATVRVRFPSPPTPA